MKQQPSDVTEPNKKKERKIAMKNKKIVSIVASALAAVNVFSFAACGGIIGRYFSTLDSTY